MSFSAEWEERYKEGTHLSIWPWSDMVSFVMRYARPAGKGFRVLELGCGAGANIPFFDKIEADYYSIEGSSSIVEKLRSIYPHLREKIVAGDFTKSIPFEPGFDLVVDRGSLIHNDYNSIRQTLLNVKQMIVPGGGFIAIDWFSIRHDYFHKGEPTQDEFTKTNYTEGPFVGVGAVHYFDKQNLMRAFEGYEVKVLEEVVRDFELPEKTRLATWNLFAKVGAV